jgi:hypothetical protein
MKAYASISPNTARKNLLSMFQQVYNKWRLLEIYYI